MPNNFFRQNLQRMSKTDKENMTIEFHHRSSLGTKFQRKLKIVIFWTKLTKKKYFQSTKK